VGWYLFDSLLYFTYHFISEMVSKGTISYGKTGNFDPKTSHFNKW